MTVDINVKYADIEQKVVNHLSVIGRRAVDQKGNTLWSTVTAQSAEMVVIRDYIESGVHKVVSTVKDVVDYCSGEVNEEDTSTEVVTPAAKVTNTISLSLKQTGSTYIIKARSRYPINSEHDVEINYQGKTSGTAKISLRKGETDFLVSFVCEDIEDESGAIEEAMVDVMEQSWSDDVFNYSVGEILRKEDFPSTLPTYTDTSKIYVTYNFPSHLITVRFAEAITESKVICFVSSKDSTFDSVITMQFSSGAEYGVVAFSGGVNNIYLYDIGYDVTSESISFPTSNTEQTYINMRLSNERWTDGELKGIKKAMPVMIKRFIQSYALAEYLQMTGTQFWQKYQNEELSILSDIKSLLLHKNTPAESEDEYSDITGSKTKI